MVVVDAQPSADVDDPDVSEQLLVVPDGLLQELEQLGVDGDVVDGAAQVAVQAGHLDARALLEEDGQDLVKVVVDHAELGVLGDWNKIFFGLLLLPLLFFP